VRQLPVVPRGQVRAQRGLQDRGRDGQPDGAAHAAEEVAVRDDDRALGLGAVGLERDEGGLEGEADADADEEEEDDDDAVRGNAGEEDGEAGAAVSS